jgi:cytochrome b561
MKGINAMAFSISELVSAVFNGAPTPEAAEKYTAQLTAIISLYICLVAIFVVGVYVRAVEKRPETPEERRLFKTWIAYSAIFSILAVAAYLLYFLISAS